nr:transposase [Rhodococcus sp. 4CII]
MRYTFRLRPGAQAERALTEEWHRCRFLWNEAVHQQKSGARPTFGKLSKLLTDARARNAWLREGSQVAQQQTLRTYRRALDQSCTVKGRGRPKFKPRGTSLPSVEFTCRGFRIRDGRLVLPKGISVPVVWSRELPSEPSSVRITRDSLGHWYASFVVRREVTPVPDATGGVPSSAAPSPTQPRTASDAPETADRTHHSWWSPCRTPQSKGYERAKRQAAKLHTKAARQTKHDSRVWAKQVVDSHELIAVEDFTPKFLARSTMARKAADSAIGAAKRELIERGVRAGRRVVLVRPAYTTMTCSRCCARAKQRLELDERVFRCTTCGYTAGRDRNAAGVILAVAERGHTCVDDVRQSGHLPRGWLGCGPSVKSPAFRQEKR